MLAHRWRNLRGPEPVAPAPVYVAPAAFAPFVPIPWSMPFVPHAQTELLYRIAFQQAQAQVARERQIRRTAFSVN